MLAAWRSGVLLVPGRVYRHRARWRSARTRGSQVLGGPGGAAEGPRSGLAAARLDLPLAA